MSGLYITLFKLIYVELCGDDISMSFAQFAMFSGGEKPQLTGEASPSKGGVAHT